ncbi:hypothetical protein J36TS2_11520 [Bacillus paralicheniformis]|nr:hypothetical protein J23TS8_06300 [Bacillus paralicheniformis]GIN48515.1 hypothetical protein J25TS1_17690 [Bacillus paralicheniformis]GIN52258.1 hypothetical protein J36TS2_11520 [Bacillus paralicheniformis]GIN77134.1 hypothetical protein J41TS8_21750 [Bacillus sp. J41TS8]
MISVDDFNIFKTKKRMIKLVPRVRICSGTPVKRVCEALYRINIYTKKKGAKTNRILFDLSKFSLDGKK